MSKFQWLKDYNELQNSIAIIELNLSRTKKELKRWTSGDLHGIKLTADSNGAKLEDIIEQLEYELAHKMNDLYDLDQLIKKFKGIEQKIIYGKYIEDKTLDEVAADLGYSSQYIYAKHAEIKRLLHFNSSILKA